MNETEQIQQFLRAARAGSLPKIIEFLNAGIDINISNQNGLNALHLASKEGRLDVVRELLSRGARVDQATRKDNTALHIACLAGQLLVVQELLQHGADVNKQSQNGFTPLYMAAQENHDAVVSFLLKHGANQAISTEEGFTPLAVALQQGHDRVVTLLLENDTRGRVRMPALHIAARKDDVNAVNLLVNGDTQVDHQTTNGFTPLHVAAHHGCENAAKALIANGADVNFQAKNNITPLHVAAKLGRVNVLQVLLEHDAKPQAQNRDGLTALHCAARSGHEKAVDILLRHGALPNTKTKNGLTPLHMSSQGDHVACSSLLVMNGAVIDETTLDLLTPLHVAAHCGNVDTARYLLNNRCEVDARALNGFTPLHVAVKKMRIKVVELLLKYLANIHATTEAGLTPLHIAAFIGSNEIVRLLLENGAALEETNLRCETALHLATRNNQTEVIQTLLQAGAVVDAKATENLTPLHLASRNGNEDCVLLLLNHRANPNEPTKDLSTPLHMAAREGKVDVIDILLKAGADPHAKTQKGFTPLSAAAKNGRVNAARRLIQAAGPATVNDVSPLNGLSPLHVAVHFNHCNMIELLLEQGADVMAATSNGFTPLHIAAKRGLLEAAELLLRHGTNKAAQQNGHSVPQGNLVERMVCAQAVNQCTPLHLAAQEGHKEVCALLLRYGAPVNQPAMNGVTSLHLAAQEDRIGVSEVLLQDSGADLSPATASGYTPLHTASHYGRARMVQFLLGHNHPVNTLTQMGSTPLHVAAQQGHLPVVKLLLSEGQADPNIRNEQGWTAAHVAYRQNQMPIYQLLRNVTTAVESWETEEVIITEEIIRLEKPDAVADAGYEEQNFATGTLAGRGGTHGRTSGENGYTSSSSAANLFYSPSGVRGSNSNDHIWDELRYLNTAIGAGDDSFPEGHEHLVGAGDLSLTSTGAVQESIQKSAVGHLQSAAPLSGTTTDSQNVVDSSGWGFDAMLLKQPINSGFLVSFVVDARGGVLQAQRYRDLRIIVPPNASSGPIRIICRPVKPYRLSSPVPLHDGNGLACRILEMGPSQMHFNSPILLEIPYYASLRGRERELVVFRSDNGDTWKEHPFEANEQSVQDTVGALFDSLPTNAEMREKRVLRILTTDLPVYFAVVTRLRQESALVGKEGGIISSTIVSQVQAVFPEGALQKPIKVGLQAQSVNQDMCRQVLIELGLDTQIRFSPVVTIEPRRRKFHRPITLTIPMAISSEARTPDGKGTSSKVSPGTTELRLLCSISGGSTPAQWEDITGSTPLTRVRDCVSFTTTVSARFWLLECPRSASLNLLDVVGRIYGESNRVPYIGTLALFARRNTPNKDEGEIRALCIIDDTTDKTLECQQEFTLVATGPPVEVMHEQLHHIELVTDAEMGVTSSDMRPLLKSPSRHSAVVSAGQRLFYPLPVRAFSENRSATIPVSGSRGRLVLWPPAMDLEGMDIGGVSARPLVTLEVQLPSTVTDAGKPEEKKKSPQHETLKQPPQHGQDVHKVESWHRNMVCVGSESIARSEMDMLDVANMVGGDWLALGRELGLDDSQLRNIQHCDRHTCEEARALDMLTLWQQTMGDQANGNELARCLRAVGREDVVKTSMHNIAYVVSEEERDEARGRLHPAESEAHPVSSGRNVTSRGLLNVAVGNVEGAVVPDSNKSVDESMIVETGEDEAVDRLRELETEGAEGSTTSEEEPTHKDGEEMVTPILDPRRGVATKVAPRVDIDDPEYQKQRQDAYQHLISHLESDMPELVLQQQHHHDEDATPADEPQVERRDPTTWRPTTVSDSEMTTTTSIIKEHEEIQLEPLESVLHVELESAAPSNLKPEEEAIAPKEVAITATKNQGVHAGAPSDEKDCGACEEPAAGESASQLEASAASSSSSGRPSETPRGSTASSSTTSSSRGSKQQRGGGGGKGRRGRK